AKHFNTEIISADSRQFYREIPIGTATPSEEEREGIPHHWMGSRSITEPVDAGQYGREVRQLISTLFEKHKVVILTGGSGLYIDAVLRGFDNLPEADEELRKQLKIKLESEGIESLQQQLKALDPVFYVQVDLNNPARLIRAIEVCISSGKAYSELRRNEGSAADYPVLKFCMHLPRPELYERINQRTLQMMQNGFEAEAKTVLPYRHLQALQTVGYKELFDYFDGKHSLDETVTLIQQHTRNYAKRQLTWIRRDEEVVYIHPENQLEMIRMIETALEK
ncbi:MAG: tRNA (adenosine(37)-N6)-dimethylallyltransferase MiaA, partial [Bacteroidia bacterium]